jgi:phosphoglycerate dehydrogenase-like enzyme
MDEQMPPRFHVIVTDYLAEAGSEKPVLDDVADITLLHTHDEANILPHAATADVLLVYHDIKLTERSLAALTRCKGIVRCGVGFDNVDVLAAGNRGIVVCNVPDYGTEEVADHALMLLLACARRLIAAEQSVRAGQWHPSVAFGTPRLRGRTLGIIGCGRIGSAMALRGKALGLRVLIYDPYQPDGIEKALGVERCTTLPELLPRTDFLSLHCPLTRETRHIVNAATLAQLPKGAYVINTARGPCVDAAALMAALDAGHLTSAALDVVEREPLDDDHVRQHPKILLTPHSAFYSVEGFHEMRLKGAQEARRLVLGEPVRNPVNLHCLKQARAKVAATATPDA